MLATVPSRPRCRNRTGKRGFLLPSLILSYFTLLCYQISPFQMTSDSLDGSNHVQAMLCLEPTPNPNRNAVPAPCHAIPCNATQRRTAECTHTQTKEGPRSRRRIQSPSDLPCSHHATPLHSKSPSILTHPLFSIAASHPIITASSLHPMLDTVQTMLSLASPSTFRSSR